MLRMTSLALAIIASLFAEALAAEETFDTNFMFGGMKGVKDSHYQLILTRHLRTAFVS